MANPNAPMGLSPVDQNGGPYTGQTNTYYIAAAEASGNMGVGDAVAIAGAADSTGMFPTVAKAAINGVVCGVITAVKMETAESPIYRAALTARYVEVCDDPNAIFEIQSDTGGGDLAATDVGNNASFLLGTFNATTGLSGTELDTSTATTTNTLDMQILRFVNRPDNAIGADANVLVRLNNHQFVDGTTGI